MHACQCTLYERDSNACLDDCPCLACNVVAAAQHEDQSHLSSLFSASNWLDCQEPGGDGDEEADGEPVHDPQHLEGPVVWGRNQGAGPQCLPCYHSCNTAKIQCIEHSQP